MAVSRSGRQPRGPALPDTANPTKFTPSPGRKQGCSPMRGRRGLFASSSFKPLSWRTFQLPVEVPMNHEDTFDIHTDWPVQERKRRSSLQEPLFEEKGARIVEDG